MKTTDFDYMLPPELIAQTPIERRDGSRLCVWTRKRARFPIIIFMIFRTFCGPEIV